MMKKKVLSTLSVVLVLGLAALGILAYLSDTDSDVNVMTLGKVSIEQHEYERAVDADGNFVTYTETERDGTPTGYKLDEFTQDKPLYPAVGTADWDEEMVYFAQLPDDSTMGAQKVFDDAKLKNAQDKFVFVENAGKSDAYVRTIVAFEIGTAENAIAEPNNANENLIMMNYNNCGWTRNFIGEATIDNNNYYIVEFVYDGSNNNIKHPDGIVHPGEFTYCNLAQVYMTPKATNEDVEALDGNKNGKYDILVLSQAVQAEGFANAATALDTAFGEITTTNHPWKEVVLVDTADELKGAVANGKVANLIADITVDESWTINGSAEVILNKFTLTVDQMTVNDNANVYISNGTLKADPNSGMPPIIIKGSMATDNVDVICEKMFYTSGNHGENVTISVEAGTLVMDGGTITAYAPGIKKVPFAYCVAMINGSLKANEVKFVAHEDGKGGEAGESAYAVCASGGTNTADLNNCIIDAPYVFGVARDSATFTTKGTSYNGALYYLYEGAACTINGETYSR